MLIFILYACQIQQSNKVPKIIAQKSSDEDAETDVDNFKTFVVVGFAVLSWPILCFWFSLKFSERM